jgi:hypothetical protein
VERAAGSRRRSPRRSSGGTASRSWVAPDTDQRRTRSSDPPRRTRPARQRAGGPPDGLGRSCGMSVHAIAFRFLCFGVVGATLCGRQMPPSPSLGPPALSGSPSPAPWGMPASGFTGFAAAAGGVGAGALAAGLAGFAAFGAAGAGAGAGAWTAIVGVIAGPAVFVDAGVDELAAAAPPQPASTRLSPMAPIVSSRERVQRPEGRSPAVGVTRSKASGDRSGARRPGDCACTPGGGLETVGSVARRRVGAAGRRIFARVMGGVPSSGRSDRAALARSDLRLFALGAFTIRDDLPHRTFLIYYNK